MKIETSQFVTSLLIGLILGGIGGFYCAPEKVIYRDTERIVNVPVEKLVEVEKVVEVKDYKFLLNNAVGEFVKEFEDYDLCGGVEYEVSEMSIKKVEDAFSYDIEDDDNYEVSFEAKVGYRSDFLGERCINKYAVNVEFSEDDVDVSAELL